MRRVVLFALVALMVCLISVHMADAKGGGGGAKAPKATAEETFAAMDSDKDGFVTEKEYLDYAKGHATGKKGFDEDKAKAHYAKIVGAGDKVKGFDLAAYKASLEKKGGGKKNK